LALTPQRPPIKIYGKSDYPVKSVHLLIYKLPNK